MREAGWKSRKSGWRASVVKVSRYAWPGRDTRPVRRVLDPGFGLIAGSAINAGWRCGFPSAVSTVIVCRWADGSSASRFTPLPQKCWALWERRQPRGRECFRSSASRFTPLPQESDLRHTHPAGRAYAGCGWRLRGGRCLPVGCRMAVRCPSRPCRPAAATRTAGPHRHG
jgi:hypothetical protein